MEIVFGIIGFLTIYFAIGAMFALVSDDVYDDEAIAVVYICWPAIIWVGAIISIRVLAVSLWNKVTS